MDGTGTYCAVRLSPWVDAGLRAWMGRIGVQRPADDLHLTLIYSPEHAITDPVGILDAVRRDSPTFAQHGADLIPVVPENLEVWDEGGTPILVMTLMMNQHLRELHAALVAAGGQHTFSDWRPHITLERPTALKPRTMLDGEPFFLDATTIYTEPCYLESPI